MELVVPGERTTEAIKTLAETARIGQIGRENIFIYDVAEAIRMRNDDRGELAL